MSSSYKPGMIVLQTKFNRPSTARGLVVRSRLLRQLNAGLDAALTLIVAPAGFGKTTLITSWIQAPVEEDGLALPSTWLALDDGDGDLNVFLRYFVTALRLIHPEACPKTFQMLKARQQSSPKVLRDTLSNEIQQLPGRFVVVLDDLHAPRGQELFNFLNEWLHHWPRQMHLVLLTRFSPPLPLSSLRVKGFLSEIRARDLRFTQAEASQYLGNALKIVPDESVITLAHQKLEGWIAGLKMASLSLSTPESAEDLAAALLDTEVLITDYLADEVFALQPPAIQQFLLKTSILSQLSASLAESLMDGGGGGLTVRECLDFVEAADLFLTPLDSKREWYRYHNVFRDVLRQKVVATLSPEEIDELNLRASAWFHARGMTDLAIHYALEAGDLELAASYMEQGMRVVLDQEDRPVLERWLRLLPEEFINQKPQLLIMKAFTYGLRWELNRMNQATARAKALLDANDTSEHGRLLRGLVGLLEGQSAYQTNQYDKVLKATQTAMTEVPPEWLYVRGIAATYYSMSLHATGQPKEAESFLAAQYQAHPTKNDSYALRLLLATVINHLQAANFENGARVAQTMLRLADQAQLPVMQGWANYLLGFIHYEWNELDKAGGYLGHVSELYYSTQLAVARNGLIGLAYTNMSLGRPDEALQIIDRLGGFDTEVHGHEQVDAASARARLLLRVGNPEAAERWIYIDSFQQPDQSLLVWMEQTTLTRARIHLARNKGSDTQTALQLLGTIADIARRSSNTRITIEVLALQALGLLNLGDNAGARKTLISAVELARRGQFTRTFVDMGPQMQTLLNQIAGNPAVSVTVGRLLDAFSGGQTTWTPAALLARESSAPSRSPSGPTSGRDFDDDQIDEHLTQRELEILALMSEPISLREIAARMTISYTTARRYTINIYSKLGVHSRWEAVEAAIKRGSIRRR